MVILWDQSWCAGFRLVETPSGVDVQEWRGSNPPVVRSFASTAEAEAAVEAATPAHIAWRQERVGGSGKQADVYVPTEYGELHLGLDPGSAVVGVTNVAGLHIYYEGNRYGAANLVTWEQRVMCAAGRLFKRYPTIAQSLVRFPEQMLVRVGRVTDDYRLEVVEQAALDAFLRRSAPCAAS